MSARSALFERLCLDPCLVFDTAKRSDHVFYDINWEEESVLILAIGIKEGNRLIVVGREEIER